MAVVEKTVDLIGDERFTALLLEKTIPDDCPVDLYDEVVQQIRNYAIYRMGKLQSALFPNVTAVGNYAFYYCGSNKAVDVTLEHTTTVPEIQTYSFQNVTGTLNVQNTNIFNQVNDQWGYGTWTINCLNPSVDFAEATITGINSMKATGEPLEVNPKVVISGVEVDAANYTLSYTLNGNPVATIQEAGTYTVTATAKGSYTGTVSTTFAVLPANITYLDENGDEQERWLEGFEARVFQHEYDHLDGKMFVDHLSPFRKQMIKSKLIAMTKGKFSAHYKCKPNRG
jgi:hypothetical protein